MRPERKESTGSGDRSSGLWNMGGEGTGHHSQPGHLDTWMYRAPLTEKMDLKGTCQPPAGGPERFPLGTLDPVQPARGQGPCTEVLIRAGTGVGVGEQLKALSILQRQRILQSTLLWPGRESHTSNDMVFYPKKLFLPVFCP